MMTENSAQTRRCSSCDRVELALKLTACALASLCCGLSTAQEPIPGAETAVAEWSARSCLLENGLAYSPFRDGQSPDYFVYPSEMQLAEDIDFCG